MKIFSSATTIEYYNTHARDFHEKSKDLDLSKVYQKFLECLPQHARILDAGCGSGRDTKHFLTHGYDVTAIDASKAMVELSTQETGLQTLLMRFEDMDFYQEFDGVWARASLLHVPYQDTRKVYKRIHTALKPSGYLCASYYHGTSYSRIEGRDFYDMTKATLTEYLDGLFEIIELWTVPSKSTSSSLTWLYFIAKRLS